MNGAFFSHLIFFSYHLESFRGLVHEVHNWKCAPLNAKQNINFKNKSCEKKKERGKLKKGGTIKPTTLVKSMKSYRGLTIEKLNQKTFDRIFRYLRVIDFFKGKIWSWGAKTKILNTEFKLLKRVERKKPRNELIQERLLFRLFPQTWNLSFLRFWCGPCFSYQQREVTSWSIQQFSQKNNFCWEK